MSGRFETDREALELVGVRAVYEAARASARRGALAEGNRRMLGRALEVATVPTGSYDDCIVEWLGIAPTRQSGPPL